MILVVGLVLLVAAIVVGVTGVFANHGNAHALTHGFAVLGYHVTGSTGTLFLYGVVVGALAVLGLGLLLGSARRTSRLGRAARRGLEQSRVETIAVRKDRDNLIDQRQGTRAERVSVLVNRSLPAQGISGPVDARPPRRHFFGHRAAPRQDATAPAATVTVNSPPMVTVDLTGPHGPERTPRQQDTVPTSTTT